MNERRSQAAEHSETGMGHVPTERVRNKINRVAELGQRADPVVLAERRPAGLEERLRGNHEDFHGVIQELYGTGHQRST